MLRIVWEVEDGYCGGSRPQFLVIDERELEGMTIEEQKEYINEVVQENFEQNISWSISSISEDLKETYDDR